MHLAEKGFRVFAGLKDGAFSGGSEDSVSSRVIRSWQKHRESETRGQGALVALPLDVTREDLLHEGVDIIRAHLPAGEDGKRNISIMKINLVFQHSYIVRCTLFQ